MKNWFSEVSVFVALIAVGVAGRLLPHEPNFTPIAATALFAGYFMRHATLAACAPLAAMLISDSILGVSDYRVMSVVYACLLAPVLFRGVLTRKLNVWTVAAGSLSASVLFFVASNFAVWLFSGMYTLDGAGLTRCCTAALPFFRNTLLGDAFWTSLLFGTYALVGATKQAYHARSAH